MQLRAWLSPPRQLIALFLAVTLLPSLLLAVFGWRLLRQDREIELQQHEARREQALDLVVSGLEQSVASTEAALRSGTVFETLANTSDSVVLLFSAANVREFPARRLPYLPVGSRAREVRAASLARGEEIEYRERNPGLAAAWFKSLTTSQDDSLRAGALFAFARNLRKAGKFDTALDAYRLVTGIREITTGGTPLDLLAFTARCSLLDDLNRVGELRREAAALRTMLLDGRWRLDRGTFEASLQQVNEWIGSEQPPAVERVALASIASSLWNDWRAGRPPVARHSVQSGEVLFTVLVQDHGTQRVALVAGPAFASLHWTSKLQLIERQDQLQVRLHDATFRAPSASSSGQVRRRSAADTGLPWTLVADDVTTADTATISGRRRLWLGGLLILGVLVTGGTYVVGRAVSRELAIARLQSDFVAAVSHEFRTPLTSLRQLSEMLLDRTHPPERARAYYEALQRQTERLHRLVESLLDFGRMEAGTSAYRLRPLDASALVHEVVEEFRSDPAARDHTIEIARASGLVVVAADRDALTNALWNLLDNAAKYSPPSEPIRVSVAANRGEGVIGVTDRGFGIPEDEQADIFRKFVRGSRAKAEGIKGTGIGLAMVHHIVSAHYGRVDVLSASGRGTTFEIRLPLARQVDAGEVQACLES